jgi:two-component system chemotaxis sensor kinase CheA
MKVPPQTLKQVEIIHTSLTGLALIAIVLLAGLLLPVFGLTPLNSPAVAGLIVAAAFTGIAGLYFMNYRAHKVVMAQARLTDVLINSLGQGFLTFNAKGICGPVYSQASLNMLLTEDIPGRPIAEILHIPPEGRQEFDEWVGVLFMPDHAMGFEDAARFMPDEFQRADGRSILLSYRAVRDGEGRLVHIVLIATDKTEEKEAQKRADTERQFASMICAIFAERQNFMVTMSELKILVEKLKRCDTQVLDADFFRDAHTLKGAVMHFKMEALGHRLHELETTLRIGSGIPSQELLPQIDQHRADIQLEFGRIQNALKDILGDNEVATQGLIEVDEDSVYQFQRLLKQQNVSPDILYAFQNTILAVPLVTLLKSLDRQMLPLAEKLEKKVRPIVFKGETVRVPARPLQRFMLALTHVVHNILDHGIEAPITRMAKGKDAFGQVTITISRVMDGDARKWTSIAITDDGAGIDPNRVRAKLMLTDPEGNWRFEEDATVIQRLLTQEVSTKDEISMVSGRGAGMSAVYQEILRLGGQATLSSVIHKGTTLTIRLPETME